MKEKFKAYAPISNKEIDIIWKSNTTLFILDTNVLLNLYSYKKDTQTDFYKILEKLHDRIWIPYHVMLEYHRNRLKVISDKQNTVNAIISWCKEIRLQFLMDFFEKEDKDIPLVYKEFKRKYPELKNAWDSIKTEIRDEFSEKIKNYIEKIEKLTNNGIYVDNQDEVYDTIEKILINIGKPYDKNFIDDIKTNGKERYKHKRPPGYKDETKDQSEDNVYYHNEFAIPYKYGDLIIWEQIKEYIKNNKMIKNVVFVTDDNKDDWIQKHCSTEKTISMARYELFDELLIHAKHINHFLISDSGNFVNKSNNVYKLNLQELSVEDVKNSVVHSDWTNMEFLLTRKPNNSLFIELKKKMQEDHTITQELYFDFDSTESYIDFLREKLDLINDGNYLAEQKDYLLNLINACKRDVIVTKELLSRPVFEKNKIEYNNRLVDIENKLSKYRRHLFDLKLYESIF